MKIIYKITLLFMSIFITSYFGQELNWIKIDDGLYFLELQTINKSVVGDSKITIIRINPQLYSLKLLTSSEFNENGLTAKNWVEKYKLICAINAGMFQADFKSNVGYMKNYNHINNSKINKNYSSVAAFNPIDKNETPFKIYDSDETDIKKIIGNYNTVIQNLRLIKHPGLNRWTKQERKWSEVALGEDKEGNILFIFSRSPYSMYEFNQNLLSFPLDIQSAQHLEGGPEASLYLKYNGIDIERVGSYETGFNENDDNKTFWAVPNVIGIQKK